GRIDRNQLIVRGLHCRIDRIARAQSLTAPLTSAMAGVERVGSMHRRLDGALTFGKQPIAYREGSPFIELDELMRQEPPLDPPTADAAGPSRRRIASAVGPVRRALLSRSSS